MIMAIKVNGSKLFVAIEKELENIRILHFYLLSQLEGENLDND